MADRSSTRPRQSPLDCDYEAPTFGARYPDDTYIERACQAGAAIVHVDQAQWANMELLG